MPLRQLVSSGNRATLKFKVVTTYTRKELFRTESVVTTYFNAFHVVLLGLWVWRGAELVFPLSVNWQVDYESYDWHRLDPAAETTKAKVRAFFLHEEEAQEYKPFDASKHAKYAGHKLYSASILK